VRPPRWRPVAAALVALLAAAHVGWWYWPRTHAGRPDPDDLPGRLLASDAPFVLWAAHPHQNLGALGGAVGGDEAARGWLAAAARRSGLPDPALPGFGPFPAPPARELAAASDATGRRVLVAARVYPLIAGIARLAGLAAGNPWLSGGEVEAFGGVATVAWDGTLWTVGTVGPEDLLAGAAAPRGEVPARLAVLRLAEPSSLLPAGEYHLEARDDGLRLATVAAPAVPPPPEDLLSSTGAAILAVSGPGGPLEGDEGALALFRGDAGRLGRLPLSLDLPAAAVWFRAGGDRFALPGEGLSSLLGSAGPAPAGGPPGEASWRLVATGSEAERRAAALTPVVAGLAPSLRFGVWARPGPALALVDEILDLVDSVPLVGREEARRWRDWQTLLAPLAPCRRASLLATADAFAATASGCGG
jgi:hypothetical protein